MDALYYADYFARAPKSTRMSKESLDKAQDTSVKRFQKKAYSWMTGARA